MMKFSRSYDRSVLIYREDGPDGRIMLRLGRTFEDGECRADNNKSIPEGFEILTYIIAKDPEALIDDIADKFGEYLDDATEMTFRSILFDTLKLQERITHEQKEPGGSDLIRSLDLIYGRQVMEILMAATFGMDGRKAGEAAKSRRPGEENSFSPVQMGVTGFVAIVVLPMVAAAIFRPEIYSSLQETVTESAIIQYATKTEKIIVEADPVQDMQARLFEQVRVRKQEFYLTSGFGEMTDDEVYVRDIPGFGVALVDTETLAEPTIVVDVETDISISNDDEQSEISDLLTTDQDLEVDISQEASLQVPDEADPEVNVSDLNSFPVVDTDYGIAQEIANFRVKAFSTYDAGDPTIETYGIGVSVQYEVSRDPSTVFEVVRGDLSGISKGLDRAIADTCLTMMNGADEALPLISANFTLDIGKSPFVVAVVNPDDCQIGKYSIYPMFELEMKTES